MYCGPGRKECRNLWNSVSISSCTINLSVWLWASLSNSLTQSFLMCKMGIIIPTLQRSSTFTGCGRQNYVSPHKDVYILTPGTCEYVMLYNEGESNLQMELRMLIS